jgi:hypothetical protein
MIDPHQARRVRFFLIAHCRVGEATGGARTRRSRHAANRSEGLIEYADSGVERSQKVAQFLSQKENVLLENDKKLPKRLRNKD